MSSGHNNPAASRRSTSGARGPTSGAEARSVSESARSFLDLFYPVHYKIGIGIEDSLRGGKLTRHQVAILWLIHSEGEEGGRSISRKQIELSITRWFELQNSAISKALRAMAKEPMGLLEIREHPNSGRERQVWLTPKGEREIQRMIERGQRFIQTMVNHLSDEEAGHGVHFLGRVSEIIEVVDPPMRGGRRAARSE